MSSRRALVIEHGMEVQDFLFSVPDREWQVTLTRSLQSALVALSRAPDFELVAIDEGPEAGPDMWQSVRAVTEASGSAPVLLFTDATSAEKYSQASRHGLAGLVIKPAAARTRAAPAAQPLRPPRTR